MKNKIVKILAFGLLSVFSFAYGNDNTELKDGLDLPYPAPAITGIYSWINSKPITLEQLKGKVILIDFWDYSCINCIRTLPYLVDWYQKYHHQGLEIIGVHSPEFDFERDLQNVANAAKKYGILYPIALDNDFKTWSNYSNQFWPAHYLIDQKGNVVYRHFGEGQYDITENNIRYLLGISKQDSQMRVESSTEYGPETPETYLGYARSNNFYSPEAVQRDKAYIYSYPTTLPIDGWALQGGWIINSKMIMNVVTPSAIKLHFHGKKVFAVLGSHSGKAISVTLRLNDQKIEKESGEDVTKSMVIVKNHDLYRLLQFQKPTEGVLELSSKEPGLEIYTFTFG